MWLSAVRLHFSQTVRAVSSTAERNPPPMIEIAGYTRPSIDIVGNSPPTIGIVGYKCLVRRGLLATGFTARAPETAPI
jgi:hypothetical protein